MLPLGALIGFISGTAIGFVWMHFTISTMSPDELGGASYLALALVFFFAPGGFFLGLIAGALVAWRNGRTGN